MNSRSRKLLRRRLDHELGKLIRAIPAQRRGGWIKPVRTALGMSGAELARRLRVTTAAVHALEKTESARTITMASLEAAAEALDCKLVYALVPKTSLEETARRQATKVAAAMTNSVRHSMRLESQEPSAEENRRQIEALAEELIDSPRQLWSSGG